MKQETSDIITSIFFSLSSFSINMGSSEQYRNLHEELLYFLQRKAQKRVLFSPCFLWAGHFPSSDPYPLVAACTFTVDWYEAQRMEGEVWLCISPTSSFSYHPQSLTQPGFTTLADNTCTINRSCWQKAILSIVCLFKTLNSSQHKEAVVC